MKTTMTLSVLATLCAFGTARAEEGKREHRAPKLPPEIIEKFDKDGDGTLNEEERKAARESRHQEVLKKFDADGDGELSREEKQAMREEMKQKALERFDKDGDGTLSDEERAEMRKQMPRRPGGHGPHREKRRGGGDAEAPGETE